jgi:hypothetical protein
MKWFTPARRKAIYGVVGAGAAALVVFGVVSQDQLNQWVQNASGIIAALTALLALLNVNSSDEGS